MFDSGKIDIYLLTNIWFALRYFTNGKVRFLLIT